MNFIKRILGLKKQLESTDNSEEHEFRAKEVPVSKSIEFLTHTETTSKEFEFLITDFGFNLSKNEFVSREYWTIYSKDSIDIEIMFEPGSLPAVTIRNKDLPYDESKQLDNRDSVEEFNPRTRELRNIRFQRRDPKQKRFMDEWLKNDNLDLTELNEDYEQYGKTEHVEYLKESASTVRENLELKKGKIKNVP